MSLTDEEWMGIRGLLVQHVNGITGTLRDIAEGHEDPEAAFREMLQEYAKVLKNKFGELIGPEEATQLLDLFTNDNPRSPTAPG